MDGEESNQPVELELFLPSLSLTRKLSFVVDHHNAEECEMLSTYQVCAVTAGMLRCAAV
jgi:hypothetical protein